MNSFNMIAGLPRAGSTLLCQILSSNPDFHVTPTSGVLDMLKVMRSSFSQNPSMRAQNRNLDGIYDNFKMGMRGFMEGFFYDSKVVFDKNRGWPGNILLLDTILGDQKSKIIWLYRDPVEIITSIESRHQKTILLENMDESGAPGAFMTLDRRIGTYANPEGLLMGPVEMLKDALEMNYGKRILLVKYFDLTNNTQSIMDEIHDFIGQPRFSYDLENVKQKTWEFDGIYNYKFLHSINEGKIEWKKGGTGNFQLEPKFIAAINERFIHLNKLVLEGDYSGLLNIPKQEQTSEVQTQNLNNPFTSPINKQVAPPPDMPGQ